jgi:Methyltransferase domain
MNKFTKSLEYYQNLSRELFKILGPLEGIFKTEILNLYPHSLAPFPSRWIDELEVLSDEELFHFDCKNFHLLPPHFTNSVNDPQSLIGFVIHLKALAQTLPQFEPYATELTASMPLEDWAFKGVKEKKRHEIHNLLAYFTALKNSGQFAPDFLIDLGGGVGHLGRILALYGQLPTLILEMNEDFIEKGERRLKKYRRPKGHAPIFFQKECLASDTNLSPYAKFFSRDNFSNAFFLGLHTCGPLANTLIKQCLHHQSLGLMNFGCCYHKLNPHTDFPLSEYYQKEFPSFRYTLETFTLATRAHGPISKDQYLTKKQVKYFRYALHFFLHHQLGVTDQYIVGENAVKDYWGNFSDYAHKKLIELNLPSPGLEVLESFYQKELEKPLIHRLYLANLIRWQLGRGLEIFLLLDRLMLLSESGYETQLISLFEEEQSPRNLAIISFH